MFFSRGNSEAIEAGYEEVEDFTEYFIRTNDSIKRFCDKAIELIDEGYQVVVGYESMAIGGSEGYVTLLAKKKE